MSWDGLIPFYGTADLEKTHHFYAKLLGLRLHRDQGLCRIYQVVPGAYVGFCTHMEPVPPTLSPIITLLTEDVDGVYRRLESSGVSIESEPKDNPRFGIYHFFVQDPDGYKVEIQRFADGNP